MRYKWKINNLKAFKIEFLNFNCNEVITGLLENYKQYMYHGDG